MSQTIQFFEPKSGCKAAIEPILVQPAKEVLVEGDQAITDIVAGATGDPAPYGGAFVNKGCKDLIIDITYLVGGDCDGCNNPDTLATSVIPFTVPANSVTPIPDGFWSLIAGGLEAAVPANQTQTVSFLSCYTPDCPDCFIYLP